jgi:hypothetical protein
MAVRKAVFVNSVCSILRRVVTVDQASRRSMSDYCLVDEHTFWLSEEQKQVMHLYFFRDSQICLQQYYGWKFEIITDIGLVSSFRRNVPSNVTCSSVMDGSL